MTQFTTKIDLRSRKSMVAYLAGHFRYDTMNSWNRSTSYAHNVKIHRFVPNELMDNAFDLVLADSADYRDEINEILADFAREHDWSYQIGFNGRSGGYLVLYKGERRVDQHKSRCTACGQRNFMKVHEAAPADTPKGVIERVVFVGGGCGRQENYLNNNEAIKALSISDEDKMVLIREAIAAAKTSTLDNTCGVCRQNTRVNAVMYQTAVFPGKSLGDHDFDDAEEWPMERLRREVKLVQSFDETVQRCADVFLAACSSCVVEEETVMVPQTRMVARCAMGG